MDGTSRVSTNDRAVMLSAVFTVRCDLRYENENSKNTSDDVHRAQGVRDLRSA
eukprot:CAMPEP_0119310944 /NCGR_PEP_ID=MMETSP1333-20130426/20942_1 /TAXON_ID=418940 /ORGANISM="Scyphosphaera apsteinii, Strain RCC1455" /LENGTH=52 /DNA_ID=CAMNT_0007315213 /DNA_START=1 /DNA_END=159 /DNA_ORIENTATION=-